ncbi:MAG TPA: response regulator [Kofleriaceae bacterium]|nr:response regulator [Kofleriaceae bacterium]
MQYTIDADADPDDLETEQTTPGTRHIYANVLVAEDDQQLRTLISARLRREGFAVEQAPSGTEMLARLLRTANDTDGIDLIILDHLMPGCTGLEIVEALRRARWSIPVVMITAFPEPGLVERAHRLDVRVVAKPFSMDRLSETAIAAILDARSAPGASW